MTSEQTQGLTPYDEFLDRLMRGEAGDPADFLAAHPEISAEQREQVQRIAALFEQKTVVEADPEWSDDQPAVPERTLGAYRLKRQLGEGGMGVVWLADEIGLDREVAIKILRSELDRSPEALERLRREAKAAAQIQHPSVVTVYGAGEEGAVRWLAMEYVDGKPLDRVIAESRLTGKSLERDDVIRWCRDIARGLAAAHDQGVVHRDVKPANILIGESGVKLVDFGIAYDSGRMTMTQTGTFRGTPYYASPEQVAARRIPIDRKTDIYSLGVTLYEIVTGETPFDGETREQVFQQILMKEPVPPRKRRSDISRDLETVILTAMEKDPDRRYESATAFADDLDALLSLRPVTARPIGPVKRALRWMRRNPYRGVAAALLAAMLVAVPAAIMISQSIANAEIASKLLEIERLADSRDARLLRSGPRDLWPARASNLPALDGWIAKADELKSRRDLHEASLARWEPNISDPNIAWRVDVVRGLLRDLDAIDQVYDMMASRRDFAARGEELTVTGVGAVAAWDAAISGVRSAYDGLKIAPQRGLVPMGPDPDSGLWEFWHPLTGERPVRDPETGRLALTEGTGMVFVLVPGGTFAMGARRPGGGHAEGSPNVDPRSRPNESPVHQVTLDPFFISKYEMTTGQVERCFGKTALLDGSEQLRRGLLPIGNLSPVIADQWARSLELTVPTEAQWERAYRGGASTAWPTGDKVASLQGYENTADRARAEAFGTSKAGYEMELDDGYVGATEVGRLKPNAFGIHDMGGNLAELCRDHFTGYDAAEPREGDGLREVSPSGVRVARGGAYSESASLARSASRLMVRAKATQMVFGLRLARPIED